MRITQFERIAPLLVAAAIGGCAPMSGGTRPSAENNNTSGQPNGNLNSNTNTNININMNSGPPPSPLTGQPGAPISPLTAEERAMFDAGRGLFEHEFTSSEGLGPQLNATSCRACHDQGGTGGGGARYRNTYVVARSNGDGTVSRVYSTFFLPAYGPSQIFPSYAGDDHPPTPATADIVAQRNPPALFGIGLLELVSDQTLMNLQDPDDANADGISGRVNLVDTQIGRFGYKAQGVSIEAFTRGTLQEHCGITSDPLPASAARTTSHGWLRRSLDKLVAALSIASPAYAQVIGPGPPPSGDGDSVPEPELNATNLRALIVFQQKLAAPLRGEITDAVQRGEALFQQIGCDDCHVATLSISLGEIHPYSDLLLHDMGAGLVDGMVLGRATGSEFRTAPLWGVRCSAPYLHDGRADTLDDAILAHGGEAQVARDRFANLDDMQRADLLAFLNSL